MSRDALAIVIDAIATAEGDRDALTRCAGLAHRINIRAWRPEHDRTDAQHRLMRRSDDARRAAAALVLAAVARQQGDIPLAMHTEQFANQLLASLGV